MMQYINFNKDTLEVQSIGLKDQQFQQIPISDDTFRKMLYGIVDIPMIHKHPTKDIYKASYKDSLDWFKYQPLVRIERDTLIVKESFVGMKIVVADKDDGNNVYEVFTVEEISPDNECFITDFYYKISEISVFVSENYDTF
jgi:hypothetical protein